MLFTLILPPPHKKIPSSQSIFMKRFLLSPIKEAGNIHSSIPSLPKFSHKRKPKASLTVYVLTVGKQNLKAISLR